MNQNQNSSRNLSHAGKRSEATPPMSAQGEPVSGKNVSSGTSRSRLGDRLSRRLWRLDSDKLCAAARRRTGLTEFGDPPIQPALSILVDSLEGEADLHPLGRFLMRFHLRGLLETRLRLEQLWHSRAVALESAPRQRPIFITGMPRSGSTYLHELLTEDPHNRAPRVWEVMFPVGGVGTAGEPDARIKKAEACLWWFRRLAPRSDEVFPLRACTPHECVAMHSYSFLSEEFVSTCRVPSYEGFLRSTDLSPAYIWQRRFLNHLQSNSPTRRWVLKSPDHVYGLEELFRVFPEALIIQTHRNPLEVLRSSCQLTEVLYRLYGRAGRRGEIAARESRMLAGLVERLVHFRDNHPELAGRFVDVNYSELTADPLATVERIYTSFEIPLSRAAIERMRALADQRSRYRNRHRATATADFGLESLGQEPRFERYCSRFRIRWEPAQFR